MSDQGLDDNLQTTAMDRSPVKAGAMLREVREAQGLHIAALAVALKVPVRKLEALEAGRFEQLPDMVFARSLALSVCRTLKVDPAPIMASLPEPHATPFRTKESDLNTAFKDSGPASHRGVLTQISTPLGLVVLFLVVAIAAILAWPEASVFEGDAVVATDASPPPVATEQLGAEPAQMVASEVDSSVSPSVASPVGELATQLTVDRMAASASDPTVLLPNNPATPQSVAAPTQPAVLELSGRGESWVEVTDAAGQPKLRKTIVEGEVIRVTGQLPLSVIVGRADVVSVSVRGKPFDLTPLARENVARFEVK